MEDLMRKIRSQPSNIYFDVNEFKAEWLNSLSGLEPNWVAFFSFGKRSIEVLRVYKSKESEYLQKAQDAHRRAGINPIDAKTLFDDQAR